MTTPPHGQQHHSRRNNDLEAAAGFGVVAVVVFGFFAGWFNDTDPRVADANHKAMTVARLVSGTTSQAAAAPTPKGLRVTPDGPMTGYSRAAFGPAWADVDRNGCDTRNDVLARDLKAVVKRGRCVVISGQLTDPYTQRPITFTKAKATAVQIDHVVALGKAWRTGAAKWTPAKRAAFANDPLNLLAVSGDENEIKSDQSIGEFQPRWLTDTGRCTLATRTRAVVVKYRLTVTQQDAHAITAGLAKCPRRNS